MAKRMHMHWSRGSLLQFPDFAQTPCMTTRELDLNPVRAWLNDLIHERGSTVTAVARAAGTAQSTLARFMSGATEDLRPSTLAAIAAAYPDRLPVEVQELIAGRQLSPPLTPAVRPAAAEADRVPVWAAFPRSESDEFTLNMQPVTYLGAPVATAKFGRLAAFYAFDDAMAPRWTAGEPVLVDLFRPAAAGEVCLARLAPDRNGGLETFLFRILGRRTDGHVRFTSFARPDQPTTVPIARILEVRRVLNWADLLT